ncbi:MAG: phosphatidate cytidylyltransferase [Bacteroidetes bacterium]|nr:MAG: phosphatidate cytidylyltransferase [Bacteroidota bacterium]
MTASNLTRRVITALVAVGIVIPALIWSAYGMWLFCFIVSMVSLWEFFRALGIQKRSYYVIGLSGGLVIWLVCLLRIAVSGLVEMPAAALLIPALLILPALELFALFDKSMKTPGQLLGAVTLGYIYCYLPFFLFFQLAVPEIVEQYDFRLPLGILWLTWTLDVFAYFIGRFFGKRPLFLRISPKKTWEGAVGSAIACLGMGWLMQTLLAPQGYSWLIIASIICIFSQLGDLVESMFKRSVHLKDSGGILPGHGGMLDRFDGMFFSLLFIYFYFLVK